MTETKTFKFGLDQFTDAGKALLKYAEQHPTEFGICCLGIAAGLVTIIVPLAMGFSAAGPVIGELSDRSRISFVKANGLVWVWWKARWRPRGRRRSGMSSPGRFLQRCSR